MLLGGQTAPATDCAAEGIALARSRRSGGRSPAPAEALRVVGPGRSDGESGASRPAPAGFPGLAGEEARLRRGIEGTVRRVFEGWDYEEVLLPLLDRAGVFPRGLLPGTYSFVGPGGDLLALRPEMGNLLARAAAGRLRDRPLPARLFCSGEVARCEPVAAGRQADRHQMGLERVGGETRAAEAEVLAIAAESLERLGARGWVLVLGHAGVFSGLLRGTGLGAARLAELRDRVESKDATGVRGALRGSGLAPARAEAVERIAVAAGPLEVLDEAARAVASCPPAARAVEELRALAVALGEAGLSERLAVDLGVAWGDDAGLVFRVFARGLGFELGGGGRHDTLLARFGRRAPAVGLSLGLDRLALLLRRQGVVPGEAVAPATTVRCHDLGAALGEARARRASGGRVRFGEGGAG